MPKHKPRRIGRKNAIQNALGQLGRHAKGGDAVAYPANFGIQVSEGLVGEVKAPDEPVDLRRRP